MDFRYSSPNAFRYEESLCALPGLSRCRAGVALSDDEVDEAAGHVDAIAEFLAFEVRTDPGAGERELVGCLF